MKTLQLNPNTTIPSLGFGTWQLTGKACQQAVATALAAGHRHLDTADRYGNHADVAAGIADSGIKRSDIFLTTKVWRDQLHAADLQRAAERFLQELQTEYLDLLLIHWPNRDIPIDETLGAMASLQKQGIIKSFGVSNFTIAHLKQALETGHTIAINQVEFHPSLNQEELLAFCAEHDIRITAYSPIAQGADLQLPIIQTLAEKYQRSPAQVILNWLLSKDMIVIPRSSKPERIADALLAQDWQLEDEDVAAIDAIGESNRIVCPPFNEFDFSA
ncbi:MAG: aldo/keto reductase [Patescibacteria group bacterium]